MQCDDVQLYLVFFCGLLLLLKQKLCPRIKTPATYSIKSTDHSSFNQHKLEQDSNKQSNIEQLGLLKLATKLGLLQEFLTKQSIKGWCENILLLLFF